MTGKKFDQKDHDKFKKIMLFLEYYYKLKEIKRTGWVKKVGIDDSETVTDHVLLMIVLALLFADNNNFSNKRKIKLIIMILLHDLGESMIGDLTPETIEKSRKLWLEDAAIKSILKKIPSEKLRNNYLNIWTEFLLNKSFDSKFVHLIDKLEMVLQAKYYSQNKKNIKEKDIQAFYESALKYAQQDSKLIISKNGKSHKENKNLEEIKKILTFLCK